MTANKVFETVSNKKWSTNKKIAMYMRVGNAEEFKAEQKTAVEENCKLENITVDLYSTDELIENVLYGEIKKFYIAMQKGEK